MFETWLSLSIANKIVSVILVWLSIGVFLLALGLFISKLKLKPKKISKGSIEFTENDENKVLEEKNLMKHRFFILMDTLKVEGYIMHDVGDCDKKRISIAFLKECMFKTVNEEIKNYIKELEESGGEAIRNMVTLIPKITDLVHEKSKLIKIELTDGIVIQGVPQIYIDKFNGWHYHHNKLLLDNIQSILTDTFYPDWFNKASAGLSALYDCMYMTVYDSNLTLGQLDGNLEEEIKKMKGRKR